MKNNILIVLFVLSQISLSQSRTSSHYYHFSIKDYNRIPIESCSVNIKYYRDTDYEIKTDTILFSSENGKVSLSIKVDADPDFKGEALYSSKIEYAITKDGYYSQSGMLKMYLSKIDIAKDADIVLTKPSDYFSPSYLVSKQGKKIRLKILEFINSLQLQSLLSDSYLDYQSIDQISFKQKSYLTFRFINTNTYNSLKLSKYDVAKRLFDEVVRKILNPLNDNLVGIKEFYGYDLTVVGYVKDFSNESSNGTAVHYRFMIPKEIVKKYKEKDISGQQVLDSSILLMDDERIELKLQ